MLVDIDKNSPGRRDPRPNAHDIREASTVMAHGTNSVNYVTAAVDLTSQTGGLNGQFTIVSAQDIAVSLVSVPGPGAGAFSTTTVRGATVAHDLNFIPALIAYYGSSSTIFGGFPSLNYNAVSSAAGLWFTVQASADSTNIYIDFVITQFGSSDTTTLAPSTVRVYLLQQTSN